VSYFYGIDRLNRELGDNIFPRLTERVDTRIEIFFKPSITGLSLLSETLDWPSIMQKAASDPRWLKSNMKEWAAELDISSVGVSDRYRRIVWDYWSDKPIVLDPSLPRDKWFFDFWKRGNIPDWTFTLYSESHTKDYQLYMDRVIRDNSGHPVGSIAGQISLTRLREHLLPIVREGERVIILDDSRNAVIDVSFMEIAEGTRLFGIDNSRVEDNNKSGETSLIKKILLQHDDYGHFKADNKNIIYKRTSLFNGAIPILTIMDTSYHLQKEKDVLIKELIVLFFSFVIFIGGVLITMMLFTQRLKTLAMKLEKDKTKFEDLLFIITHSFANEILMLQKNLAGLPDRTSNKLYLRLCEMSLMIQNSVNAVRLDSGRSLIISNTYDFSWQWDKLTGNFEAIASAKGQRFISSPAVSCMINNDEEMVYQILANFVSNAVKYAPSDGTVKLNAGLEGDSLLITISDSGPGFMPEDRKELFSKFKRLSAKPSAGERSTGLGLYIVKQLADACNIKINLLHEIGEFRGAVWVLEIKTDQSSI
jgi:two-component sensor histidine kinase